MPDSLMMTPDALVGMTSDAMLIIDPATRTIRLASPRAMDLIGPGLGQRDTPVSIVFSDDDHRFTAFVADSLTVTQPIMSSVSLQADRRVLSAKGRRLSVTNGPPQVLLLLEAESQASHRFRLLSEKIEELKDEVRRRTAAERELSDTIVSLRRSVNLLKEISELDISSGDYLHLAALAVSNAIHSRGAAVISVELGKLRVMAATGCFAEPFHRQQHLDLSLAALERLFRERGERWKQEILASLGRAGQMRFEFDDALILPLSVSGELRGALLFLEQPRGMSSASAQLEGAIIADALGSLIARAEIEGRLIHAQKLQAIGQLTGGIAHDFNNILAVVLGNAELLLEEMDNLDLDLAREIREAAMRGATLTSRLLSFARKQPLNPKSTDANRLLREFDPLIRRTIKENIDFELIASGGIWKTEVDQNQLENAVLNLAVNARDAMPDGGRLTIETANTRLDQDYADQHAEVRPGQYVMIAVSDTGHGMDPEVMQEAFTPFFTTKEVGKGSGLGLSMVFGFVKQSLGHVKIYSEPGLGTTVRMYFPRDPTEVHGLDTQNSATFDRISAAKGLILVVEDDPGVLRYLKKSLEMVGYIVEGMTTGEQAAKCLERQTYDVLLTDVVLPGETDGAKLAKIAQRIAPTMPVLFMSGYTENSIVHHGRLDPGVDFISKPFTRDQLAKRLKTLIGN